MAGISRPMSIAIIAGSRNTHARHDSCHFLGSNETSQYSKPRKPSSAARLSVTTTIALSTSHIVSPQG